MSRGGLKPATKTRKQIERAELARDAARLRRTGLTYREIAAQLPCSTTQVHRLVHEGIDSYLAEAKEESREWVATAIADLVKVSEEAWREWQRSKKDRQRTTTKRTDDGTETTEMVEGRLGDPRYLERIESCVEKIGKLRGVFSDEEEVGDVFEEYEEEMEESIEAPPLEMIEVSSQETNDDGNANNS